MATEKLLVTLKDGIKRITFNCPERRNAVEFETMKLFHDAIHESIKDESRVVIVTGAGDAFCSGADLRARTPENIRTYDVSEALRVNTNTTILAMRGLPKPVIARVHGPAAGIGCNYALACDIRIASEQARFGEVFIKIGLMPDGGGTFFLPRLVGYAKAFELMATGDVIGAREALALGLVNRVVPVQELDSAVDSLAERLAASPALALGKIKQALNRDELACLESALEFEAVNQGDCFRSADFLEGVSAFLEKRPPKFR